MKLKQKAFRIDQTLATAFEAWCEQKGYVQERVAEALLLWVIGTTPEQRDDLMHALAEHKARQADEPATGGAVGAKVAAALRDRRRAKERSKRKPGRRSA